MARQLGIVSAPNALFFVAVAFILLLLLHFSAAMSRLGDQSKVLAQRQAILEQRLRELERTPVHSDSEGDADDPIETMLRSSSHRGS
jgi:hypothetical protein